MKLSPETIEILKNFSNINNAIVISPGNTIRTINPERNVFSKAVVEENFPRDIPIYELRQFLNIFTLHKDADVDFSDEHYILVEQGKTRMKFYYADLYSLLNNIKLPAKDYIIENPILKFNLESSTIERIRKAANMYSLTDLSLMGNGYTVDLVIHNKEDATSRSYNIEIAESEYNFCLNFVEKNIMILPGAYDVEIANLGTNSFVSRFNNQERNLEYIIALEPDSTFDL
jgi:hypothetical protein